MHDLIEMLYICLERNIEKECKYCECYDVCKIIFDFPRASIKLIEDTQNHFYSIHYAEGEC